MMPIGFAGTTNITPVVPERIRLDVLFDRPPYPRCRGRLAFTKYRALGLHTQPARARESVAFR